ncbi:glutamate racemase [Marinomonas sp. 15G1-11]|uniref:Glutamate racemase n=1 Tax=Marinomonas phaeophyticola TaxID=3004091 RepID=A0ABT4JXW6_9GAMM|nr:glutamate racemase [Marinomonas sp. 15G1-11]MCZ2722897.1 glutamate racemase [Marinomonas sp. 15G1-11]
MQIAVFDSGIGGTSVLEHLKQYLPYAHFSYFMDNLYMPYGNLSLPLLHERLIVLVNAAIQKLKSIDLIVLACNTASTQGLDLLRQHINIPIIGVVPAVKPACLLSQKSVGLLATPATVGSSYIQGLIAQYALNKPVYLYGSTELVHLAEEKFWQGSVSPVKVKQALQKLNIHPDIDCLVLGCTHFPILKAEIQQALGKTIQLIDSGEAIARRAKALAFALNSSMVHPSKIASTSYFSTSKLKHKHDLMVECLTD